jgi:serine/threonine protein phosphatase PrpC
MSTPQPGQAKRDGAKRGHTAPVRFEAVGVTDIGRQRKHNEDHVLLRPELDLFVVADGMGGHNAGDVASKLATASLRNFYEATVEGPVPEGALSEGYNDLSPDARRLAAAIRKANRDVFEISSTYRQHQGMGSTVVAAYLVRSRGMMHVGHVGDSRCYRFRYGELVQLTHDHSLVNDALALKPDLTPEELARLPKNIITRALGMREDVKVDIRSEEVVEGDIFLLCSDGLSGMVDEDEMARVLGGIYAIEGADLREACESLVSLANEAGGNDNITALLIRIEGRDLEGHEPDPTTDISPAPGETDDAPEVSAAPARMNTDEIEAVAAAERTGELVICPACEAEVVADNDFCTECGASLTGDS